jgi:hypothetical protein
MSECEKEQIGSCGACALRENCTMPENDHYTRSQRWKALALAYIVPFVLLAGVIAVTDAFTDNEYIIGRAALATVAAYYLVLFLAKPTIESKK